MAFSYFTVNLLKSLQILILVNLCNGYKYPDKYIDLTYGFNNKTALWPGQNYTFYMETEGVSSLGFWVSSRGFCIPEHISTHIDAPYHLHKEGWKLHEIPLDDLVDITGVMINIYDKVHPFEDGSLKLIENYELTKADVLEWEKKHGKIPRRSVVLVRSGWGSRWGNQKFFSGKHDENEDKLKEIGFNFPGIGRSAAKFLAAERQVLGVGIDTLSVDPGNSKVIGFICVVIRKYAKNKFFNVVPTINWFIKTGDAHRTFASRNIYMLENVANLPLLPPKGFNLWILPFKVDYATGAPARVLAKLHINS